VCVTRADGPPPVTTCVFSGGGLPFVRLLFVGARFVEARVSGGLVRLVEEVRRRRQGGNLGAKHA